jgi:hypothetical protein
MTEKLRIAPFNDETPAQARARVTLTPECLSASVLVICQSIDHAHINEVVDELSRQTAALNSGDMTRAENMLLAQAHTLDGLFAKLTSQALTTNHLDNMDRYLRLALKAQSQARATLQTLSELKTPKQIAFVKQANIGNQIQVNNGAPEQSVRTRKIKKTQNELLEVEHGERLDTRATSSTSGADPTMATLGKEHRPAKRRG